MPTASQNYRQHADKAAELCTKAADALVEHPSWVTPVDASNIALQAAQVHATLALAAATLNQTHVLQQRG